MRALELSQNGKDCNSNEKKEEKEKENKRKKGSNEEMSKVRRDIEKKEYSVKYVGESGCSAYERGKEHVPDFHNLNEKSHLLKHYMMKYQNEIKMQVWNES